MTGSVKRWGNRMPCDVEVPVQFSYGVELMPCGVQTIHTMPDANGAQRRICRAHIEEQREAAIA